MCMDAWISSSVFIDFCGFARIPLSLLLSVLDLHGSPYDVLWISVDLHGCMDFPQGLFMDVCGIGRIPLSLLLSVVDLH